MEFKVKEGVSVHKIVPGFGGIDINAKTPAKLIAVCVEAGLTQYFEEIAPAAVNVQPVKAKADGKGE
jgi:hypothetical protein